jgi:uncharacterized protein YndB with AHSA1/START domain
MEKDTISIDIVINAPAEMVWKAWTDPNTILNWFGSDPEGRGLKATTNPQAGGSYEISFCNRDGTEFTCFGKYVDVQPYRKLSFSWEWKNEPGVESYVTIIFTPENNRTRMQFEHSHVGTESAHNYLEGWNSTFAKLGRLVTKGVGLEL